MTAAEMAAENDALREKILRLEFLVVLLERFGRSGRPSLICQRLAREMVDACTADVAAQTLAHPRYGTYALADAGKMYDRRGMME